MRDRTYIAADFDHYGNAINHLKWMNRQGLINFLDAHELQQSNDSSLSYSTKSSIFHCAISKRHKKRLL